MDRVVAALRAIEREGVRVERLCVGGTPGFLPSFEELVRRHHVESRVDVEVSPGTFIYWDSKYDALMPGRFRIAAVILARVMDRTAPDRATLDLGYKRWAIDQGPVDLFSVPGLEVVSTSEEHTVVRSASGESLRLEVGDPVLIAPRHVCATVNLWERFWLVGSDGKLRSEPLPVSARNR
jgi:D-serine deaminase-like pyridoxal phosphate-dependent protein